MCVVLTQYPLVELENGKRKVLFEYGKVIENRDFSSNWSFNREILDWNLAIKGSPLALESTRMAVKKYGIKNILKYTGIPCGHCEECNKQRARGWAFRILKEAELYEENYFISFDYNDEHLPYSEKGFNTLVKDTISKFNKKLKTYLKRAAKPSNFRFYGIGEYGDRTYRPHYHVMYFNLHLDDLKFHYISNGNLFFTSEFLQNLWKDENGEIGHVDIGLIGVGSACYIARYCDKKQDRTKQEKLIMSNMLQPEFSVMSRRPGIGSYYLDKLKNDFENQVFTLYSNGNEFSIPIYYKKKLQDIVSPEALKCYEDRNKMLMKIKFSNDLLLSDILATSLQDYYIIQDKFKKSCKRIRDNIKL